MRSLRSRQPVTLNHLIMFSFLPSAVRSFAVRCTVYSFLAQFVPFLILIILYARDVGFKPTEIGFLMGFWYLAVMILEIPSSIVADRFSRRHVVMIGEFACAIGFLVLWLWPTWLGFMIGLFCWALRGAFYSGTYEAYVYDELKTLEASDYYKQFMSLKNGIMWAGLLAASCTVGLYHTHGIAPIAIISILSRIVGGILIGTGPEAAKQEFLAQLSIRNILQQSIQTLKHDPKLIFLLILVTAVTQLGLMVDYRPLLFEDLHLALNGDIYFYFMTYIALIIGSLVGHYMPLERWTSLIVTALVPLVALIGFSFIKMPSIAFLLMLVTFLTQQIWLIHGEMHKQNRIPSEVRATLGSFSGLWDNAVTMIMNNVIGLTATAYTYQKSMIVTGIPALFLLGGYGIVTLVLCVRRRYVQQ